MKIPLAETILEIILFLIITISNSNSQSPNPTSEHQVIYQWNQLEYKYPSTSFRLQTGQLMRENLLISGIKISKNRIFLTIPKWREGVPASLVSINLTQAGSVLPTSPLLEPYPSWDLHKVGFCFDLQHIQSMEIDQYNRMWVLDIGRINIFTPNPVNLCPAKLVLIDLATDKILFVYAFSESVVSSASNFVNDLVVGCTTTDDCFVYIADAFDPKIVIYSHKSRTSWFVTHSSMMLDPQAVVIPILGVNYTTTANVDGIALSPKDSNFDRVYYSSLNGFDLFSVSTSTLKTSPNGFELNDLDVTNHGRKSSQSDGLAMDSRGNLYYGLLSSNAVGVFNTTPIEGGGDGCGVSTNGRLLVQNDVDLQWPDTFAFDKKGYLYVTTARAQRFLANNYNFNEVNFRISRVDIGAKSYMYSAN